VVAHVVLFDLKTGLTREERHAFMVAFTRAVAEVPSVRDVRVGRRTSIGAAYEAAGDVFSYFAVLEFDDETGLRAYLEHPVHAQLGTLFWSSTLRSMVGDYMLAGNDLAHTLAGWSATG
jgi:uncharacterized membrane protein